jgi:hypothetical protein
MIKKLKLLIIVIFFTSCSTKQVPNQWQYKSTDAFNSYSKNFLKNNKILAKSYFKTSVKYAKQSANFDQLARIYLGKCALNKSVDKNYKCIDYNNIKDLADSKYLASYYSMLHGDLQTSQIKTLPSQYKLFAKHLYNKQYKSTIFSTQPSNRFRSK